MDIFSGLLRQYKSNLIFVEDFQKYLIKNIYFQNVKK